MTTGTRGGNGRFTRTAGSVKRDAEAASLRARGYSFQRIADELGFASKGKAHDAVMRSYADIPGEDVKHAKALDLERIDRLIEQAWDIMLRPHVTVSQGHVVGRRTGWERDDNGEIMFDGEGAPIPVFEDVLDDGPATAAIREIRALLERRAKMIGYDAPTQSRIEVITDDMVNAEIARLTRELEEGDDRAARPGVA
jgi:hypothetical protein